MPVLCLDPVQTGLEPPGGVGVPTGVGEVGALAQGDGGEGQVGDAGTSTISWAQEILVSPGSHPL
jgi:hypothetical protein